MSDRIVRIIVILLTFTLYADVGLAANGHVGIESEKPGYIRMIGDVVIARPLMIAATVVGGAIFVVTLPFSMLGGNVSQAADTLVYAPARGAFKRCLGCTQ